MDDIDQSCMSLLLESSLSTHGLVLTETSANSESAASLVRHAAARKFSEADAIEAAAAEMILQKTP